MSSVLQNIEKKDEGLNTQQTLKHLQRILHTHLLMCDLHLHNTQDKMMKMLRREGDENWTASLILELAKNNKIMWPKGSSDPTDYNTYQHEMNARLAEILG